MILVWIWVYRETPKIVANCQNGKKHPKSVCYVQSFLHFEGCSWKFRFFYHFGQGPWSIHPWKLTWNLKRTSWKRRNIYKPPIFGFQPLVFGGVVVSLATRRFPMLYTISACLSALEVLQQLIQKQPISFGKRSSESLIWQLHIIIYGCQPKNWGKTPKMDGENNGKPYEQMDDLGVPIFLETPIYICICMLNSTNITD